MERKTYRLPSATLREVRAHAARRGVSDVQYIRAAIERQLGRDTCLDEVDRLAQRVDLLERRLRRMS